ncbi:hypothetical protein TYRP_018052 [Tyrophagus putrescentiae]|nr:hypothetical protein TYRP_018052 [Tyrophagus putrescentiae]
MAFSALKTPSATKKTSLAAASVVSSTNTSAAALQKKEIIRTYIWRDATRESIKSIKDIVKGGYEEGGETLYICRCLQCEGGHKIPGKVSLKEGICRVPFNTKEHQHPAQYQVLTNPDHYQIDWFGGHLGSTPEGAVPAGEEEKKFSGDVYFICHAQFKGPKGSSSKTSLQVGKVHREHRTCYFGYQGVEYNSKDYEILVLTKESIERKQRELYELQVDRKKEEVCQKNAVPKLNLLCRPDLGRETAKASYQWKKVTRKILLMLLKLQLRQQIAGAH